ncbi:MAG TPA: hypothetical protein DCL21_01260, partial [Alphaproteobacteria bacterium]|nr:hypothetical protein [Alphaproteobacteria bacterium]
LSLGVDNINIDDTIKSFIQTDGSILTGTAATTLHAVLNKSNSLTNIHGSLEIKDGFVNLPNLYNKPLDFNIISSDFKLNPEFSKIEYNNTKLIDKNDNQFKINGDFTYSKEPFLNITVKTDKIDLIQAFGYIPDLGFKKWTDANIFKGKASNVKFGFYGPIRKVLDGKNGNPYFDIQANFEDVALTYLDDIPAVENAKGKFNLFKTNININVDSATHSKQKVKRANVKITPLFAEDKSIPLITVKAVSKGSIEDVLTVLNKKLKLNQEELFKHYKGTQETQTTVRLDLDKLDKLNDYNPKVDKFIEVDVISDVQEVIGIDPIFKQRFKATDAVVKITEDDFSLEASGFMNENPFSLILKEKLLEFGQHTDINVTSNFDSFLLKEYLNIPSFNLSGLVYSDLKLKRSGNQWNFDLAADLENSLLNFGLLNYTKPLTRKGNVTAKGYFDQKNSVLNLENSKILINDFKASGSAKVYVNDLAKSTAEFKDIKINDKTNLKEFSLKSNVLSIQGDSLDLRPLVFAKRQANNKKQELTLEKTEATEKQTIEKINIRLKKLYLNDDKGLLDVTVLLNLNGTVTGLVKGLDQKNVQNFYLRLTPIEGRKDFVKVESLIPNFGNALSKTGLYKNINSGFGIVFGELKFEKGEFDYADIKVNVKKFQLLKAPLLAKALAIISLEQLFTSKKGILFDDLYAELKYEDSILNISNAKIKGPSLGILANGAYDKKTKTTDIKGTLVPVVKLNSVLSNIPVLGYILTGSQGAISGADFKVYGTEGKQKVSVSPLSIITPGIVKDLFESVSTTIDPKSGESKVIEKARKKANIKSKETEK